MCYEQWIESKQVTEALEKARKEVERAIEKAKLTDRPERNLETQPRPMVGFEETAA